MSGTSVFEAPSVISARDLDFEPCCLHIWSSNCRSGRPCGACGNVRVMSQSKLCNILHELIMNTVAYPKMLLLTEHLFNGYYSLNNFIAYVLSSVKYYYFYYILGLKSFISSFILFLHFT